jgi:hypothetical protein
VRPLGKYEFYVLWACINSGGIVSYDTLREQLTGVKTLDKRSLSPERYHKTHAQHKQLLISARTLQDKGLVYIRRGYRHNFSTQARDEAVLLRSLGFTLSPQWTLGNLQLVTPHSPPVIKVFDSQGEYEGEYYRPDEEEDDAEENHQQDTIIKDATTPHIPQGKGQLGLL